ncbi:MAG TPA: ABC transporter permease [Solirubrobacterales bacterium]|nr:ABC transporter permease [Solirubrobacterales bacterium]
MSLLQRRPGLLPYLLLAPGLLWLVFFFLVPLYYMGRVSLEEGTIFTGYEFAWNFETYTDALSNYDTQIVRSFLYAGAATAIAFLIGYPLAYVIAFRGGRWKTALLLLVIVPFFVTYLIRTLSWQTILADSGAVVDVLKAVGLVSDDGRVLATTGAVIAGITYNFLPFMILPLYASLERIDHRMLEAGYDLYGSRRAVFTRITLPLSMPGVVAGALLTFIPAAGDFINAELLGTPRQAMIGNVIQSRYLELTDYPTAAALSFVLMALILVMVLAWAKIAGTEALMGSEAR